MKKEKECAKSGSGSDGVYKSKWFANGSMMFLMDSNKADKFIESYTYTPKLHKCN